MQENLWTHMPCLSGTHKHTHTHTQTNTHTHTHTHTYTHTHTHTHNLHSTHRNASCFLSLFFRADGLGFRLLVPAATSVLRSCSCVSMCPLLTALFDDFGFAPLQEPFSESCFCLQKAKVFRSTIIFVSFLPSHITAIRFRRL